MEIPNLNEINEIPIRCVIIKDFSENYIRYDLIHSSLVQDLVNFINKLPIECIFQNYKLEIEKTGKRIYNEDNLFLLQLQDFDIIKMVPNLYDPSTAKQHFEIIKYILTEYPLFSPSEAADYLQNVISKDYNKLVENSKKYFNEEGATYKFFNYLMDDQMLDNLEEEANDELNGESGKNGEIHEEKDAKEKEIREKEIENMKKIIKKNQKIKKPLIQPNKINYEEIKQKILDMDFKKNNLTNLPTSYTSEAGSKAFKYNCVDSIYISSYNCKLETNDAPKGDLLYIEAVTLENNHYFITCSEKGFFVNNSKINSFDPTPLTNSFTSYTLPGLLSCLSPLFKENFAKTLSQNPNGDDLCYIPTPNDRFEWLINVESPFTYNYRFRSFTYDKYDQSMINREWNEEYQGILDIKNQEGMNIEAREKLLVPFYTAFKEVAMQGAKLIVNKKLKPFSLSESPAAGYYIYGNIFITTLEDSPDFTVSINFNKIN